jgi:hypothetical protein
MARNDEKKAGPVVSVLVPTFKCGMETIEGKELPWI